MKIRICDRCHFQVPYGNAHCWTCGGKQYTIIDLDRSSKFLEGWLEPTKSAAGKLVAQMIAEGAKIARKVESSAAGWLHTWIAR